MHQRKILVCPTGVRINSYAAKHKLKSMHLAGTLDWYGNVKNVLTIHRVKSTESNLISVQSMQVVQNRDPLPNSGNKIIDTAQRALRTVTRGKTAASRKRVFLIFSLFLQMSVWDTPFGSIRKWMSSWKQRSCISLTWFCSQRGALTYNQLGHIAHPLE